MIFTIVTGTIPHIKYLHRHGANQSHRVIVLLLIIIIVLSVIVLIAHLEDVRELVGHVHRHGAHPEEEADEDVLAAILLSDY